MMLRKALTALAAALFLVPVSAFAQDSHWGVAFSITPKWTVPDRFDPLFDAGTGNDLQSTDFSIGIARGKDQSGDWSVSYLRKSFKEGTSVSAVESDCSFASNGCFLSGDSRIVRGVTLSGIEALKFIPFANIKQRVQIGAIVGGGIGSLDGTLERHRFSAEPIPPFTSNLRYRQTETVTTLDAKEELFALSVVPLFKAEIAASVLVAPGLKIRASGGLDFPGQNMFRLTAVYLLGSK